MSMIVVAASFPLVINQKVGIIFEEKVEISLDCVRCQKKRRTLEVFPSREASYCTPTHHPFPGYIQDFAVIRHAQVTEAIYTVAYDYTPFEDTRDRWQYDPLSHEMPTWGRVAFALTCSDCGQQKRRSTQSNLVRPWSCRCVCGCLLYEETRSIPLFEHR